MDMRTTSLDLQFARSNRQLLATAGVFAVNIIGGAGCGKTSLLELTVRRLILKRRVGVIAADPQSRSDADRLAALGDQVLQIETGADGLLTAEHVGDALRQMDLGRLDLLIVENVSSLIGPGPIDLGENAKVAMFSVAAGDDKPAKYPDVARVADLVILNKTDLLSIVPFDVGAFVGGVRRVRPGVEIVQLSTLTEEGIDAWLDWVLCHAAHAKNGLGMSAERSPSPAGANPS